MDSTREIKYTYSPGTATFTLEKKKRLKHIPPFCSFSGPLTVKNKNLNIKKGTVTTGKWSLLDTLGSTPGLRSSPVFAAGTLVDTTRLYGTGMCRTRNIKQGNKKTGGSSSN